MGRPVTESNSSKAADETHPIDFRKLDACVHCGLCLPACPTYDANGNELDSPRGRIQIVRGLAMGTIADLAVAAQHLDFCLGCRACETACPSGVKYGQILEEGRANLDAQVDRSASARFGKFLLRRGLGSRAGAVLLMRLLWLGRKTGMVALASKGSGRLARVARIAPRPRWRPWSRTVKRALPATGEHRGNVALVPGCVMDQGFADVHTSTARVLRRAGYDVVVPKGPLCCGALSAHVGDAEGAKRPLARLEAAIDPEGLAAVIVNAAGCGSHLKEADWRHAGRTFDVLEFLDREGLKFDPGPIATRWGKPEGARLRVAYQDACHLRHGQKVVDAPRRLLAKIPDVELVPLAEPDRCCGSAGVYNVTQPQMSDDLLRRKVAAIAGAQPDVLATANPGCHLQIAYGLKTAGMNVRVEHVVRLLSASIRD
jgi:glycolate oxidase iron-sulfur subunit